MASNRIQLSVDPDDPESITNAQSVLERLSSTLDPPVRRTAEPHGVGASPVIVTKEVDLPGRIKAMLTDKRYGANRRAYVRSVALDPLGADHERVKQAVAAADPTPKDLGRSVGGTHANIEQCWRAFELPGAAWEGHVLGSQWINYSPTGRGKHTMDPDVAKVTLSVLDEIEAEIQAKSDSSGGDR